MSGTSLDGIDAVLARFNTEGYPTILSRAGVAFTPSLKEELLALNKRGSDELARAAVASNALVDLYAKAVEQALTNAGVSPNEIRAIGAHGQTVRHCPDDGYTIQLNAPARLAELTGIDVIADFRSRDVAAGGQGAPLVPMFHAGVFAVSHTRVVLNLGGIANITILRPNADPLGFDTGPANALMDLWCYQHTGKPYDANGQWGADGTIDQNLLDTLINKEPWFLLPHLNQLVAIFLIVSGLSNACTHTTSIVATMHAHRIFKQPYVLSQRTLLQTLYANMLRTRKMCWFAEVARTTKRY